VAAAVVSFKPLSVDAITTVASCGNASLTVKKPADGRFTVFGALQNLFEILLRRFHFLF
jgi:hypothetical protein